MKNNRGIMVLSLILLVFFVFGCSNDYVNNPSDTANSASIIAETQYDIELLNGVPTDNGDGTYSWTWKITNTNPGNGKNGTQKDLSHWDLILGDCAVFDDVVSAAYSDDNENWTEFDPKYERDPSIIDCYTGDVLKFDYGTIGSEPTYYRLVLNKDFGIDNDGMLYLKFGKDCLMGSFSGIGCPLPLVKKGWEPDAIIKGAVRCRNFNNGNGGEIYLGKPGLGSGVNRVEKDFYRGTTCDNVSVYGSWQPSNHIEFSYDPNTSAIYVKVNTSDEYCLNYNIANPGTINYIQIDVVNRASGTTVDFNNVYLGSDYLGNFSASGWNNWNVTQIDLTNGFTLKGDLVLSGSQPNGETNKLEINFGYLAP